MFYLNNEIDHLDNFCYYARCVSSPNWGTRRIYIEIHGSNLILFFVSMGLLQDTQYCGLCMRRECRESFPHHRWLAIPACFTASELRTESLTSSFIWSRCRGKHSRHSWRMLNPQFYLFGKRPMKADCGPEHQNYFAVNATSNKHAPAHILNISLESYKPCWALLK